MSDIKDKTKISMQKKIEIVEELMAEKGHTRSWLIKNTEMKARDVYAFFNEEHKKLETFNKYLGMIIKPIGFDSVDAFDSFVTMKLGGFYASKYCLQFGDTQTLWYAAMQTFFKGMEGVSEHYDIRLDRHTKLKLDNELDIAVRQTVRDLDAGKYDFVNGQLLHLISAKWSPPKEPKQEFVLEAAVCEHEYALFYTLTSTYRGNRILKDRMNGWRPGEIISPLSGGVGINIAIISSDDEFIICRRSDNQERWQGPRPLQLDVGAVEGLSKAKDIDEKGSSDEDGPKIFDMEGVAMRALKEEYAIEQTQVSALKFLGFGCDLQYSQWNVLALAHVNMTGHKIHRRQKVAPHKYEILETFHIPSDPKSVFQKIANEKIPMWSCGLALTYYALCNLYGIDSVDKEAESFNLRRQEIIM